MRIRCVAAVGVAAGLLVVLAGGSAQAAAVRYKIKALGVLPGDSYSFAEGVNDRGEVVGYSTTADGVNHAFVWTPARGMRALFPRKSSSDAEAVNDRGEIVGSSDGHAFTYTPSRGMVDLGTSPDGLVPSPTAVNKRGEVVGSGGNPNKPCGGIDWFSYTRSTGVVNLGVLPGADPLCAEGRAFDVNDWGEIVGSSDYGIADLQRPVFYTPSTGMVDLGGHNDSGTGQAAGVNDGGEVVGSIGPAFKATHPFSYTFATGIVDLSGELGASSEPADVNDHGEIVGVIGDSGHAFAYTRSSGLVDLGTLPGGSDSRANRVNDHGEIVGVSDGKAVLWKPVKR